MFFCSYVLQRKSHSIARIVQNRMIDVLECCNFAEDRQHFKSLSTFALHFLCKCNPTGTCPTSIHKRIAHTRLHALTKAITRKVSREQCKMATTIVARNDDATTCYEFYLLRVKEVIRCKFVDNFGNSCSHKEVRLREKGS